MVAGSEGARSKQLCTSREIGYIETKNNPLSGKFIKASQQAALKYNPDAFLILGSDDFIDSRLIDKYIVALEKGMDVIGIVDCYFYHTGSKESMYWQGYTNFRKGETIGMARMVSKKVFNRLRGKLWPSNMDSGLDYNMMKKLKKHKDFKWQVLSVKNDIVAVDIKGQGNITDFSCYRSNMSAVPSSVLETIPEFKQIQQL